MKLRFESTSRFLAFAGRSHPELGENIRAKASYFEVQSGRHGLSEFRKPGLFVGSGATETSRKILLGRLDQSAMFWAVHAANAIIALAAVSTRQIRGLLWEARTV